MRARAGDIFGGAFLVIVFGCGVSWADNEIDAEGPLEVGGELRLRGELRDGAQFDSRHPADNDEFFLTRLRIHADWQPLENLGAFLELMDSREFESNVIDRDRVPNLYHNELDLYQAFINIHDVSDFPLSLLLGRQVLKYGNERLLGEFNWSNTGRSFDAIRAIYEDDFLSVHAFVGQERIPDNGNFDDTDNSLPDPKDDSTLWGVYTIFPEIIPNARCEVYWLLRDNDNAKDEVHTLGTRVDGKLGEAWDWNLETAYQFGDFDDQDHEAWAWHSELGYTLAELAWTPRLALEYNYATGDKDPDDSDHETFDNLYPTNHLHYGYMDIMSWRNMHDVAAKTKISPVEKGTVSLDLRSFWLAQEDDDALYNAGGKELRNARGASVDDHVGIEVDLGFTYKISNAWNVAAGYGHLFAGEYLDDTGADDDQDWVFLQTRFTF